MKIFIHCYLINDYQNIFNSILLNVDKSGLYNEVDKIYCCITKTINNTKLDTSKYDKCEIIDNGFLNHFEFPTIYKLWEYCQLTNKNEEILYCHLKGVCIPRETWRNNLIFGNIIKFREHINNLKTYNISGIFLRHNHYSGNFFWINSQIVKTYIQPYAYISVPENRYISEPWAIQSININEKFEGTEWNTEKNKARSDIKITEIETKGNKKRNLIGSIYT
jgi:hypothetical protein